MNVLATPPQVAPVLSVRGVQKRFVLHRQNGTVLPVIDRADLDIHPGECVVLDGPSGMGKSTLLKLVYANYRPCAGEIWVQPTGGQPVNLCAATPRELLDLRQHTLGYVSQFLRVIPRVSALDVVAEPLMDHPPTDPDARAAQRDHAREQARHWLTRLRIPQRLWALPPATFSGGEQQRINIARSLIKPRALLLLDEPTASLDRANTQTVIELIHEARQRGAALLGIFHDPAVAESVASRRIAVSSFRHTETPAPALATGEPA